ncbi:MAG: MFS transporter [Bradymonadaceae bacterium]
MSDSQRTSRGATSDPGPVYRNPNLLIIFAVTLVGVMGTASITPTFPRVADVLGVSGRRIGLLVTAYYVPGLVLTPLLGLLADHWGRKPVLVPSLFLFGIAGSACALARDFEMLLLLRALQGVGGASLAAMSLTIIGDLFSGDRRTAAMGYNASVLSVGTATYPTVGGALALLGWYYPFALPILAVPVGLFVLARLERSDPDNSLELRAYLGRLWSLLADRGVAAVFVLTLLTFAALFGPYLAYFPMLMSERFGSSSFVIGLFISSVSVASGGTSARLGRLTRRFSSRTLLLVAYACYAVSFAAIGYAENFWLILVPSLGYGVAQGLNIPTLQSLLAGVAPDEQRAAFMSLNGLFYRIGQTVGPTVAGVLYTSVGFCGMYLATAGMMVVGLVTVAAAIDGE